MSTRTVIAVLLFLGWQLNLCAETAAESAIYQRARMFNDLWRLDLVGALSDAKRAAVLATMQSQGMKGYDGFSLNDKTGQLTPEPGPKANLSMNLCQGKFVDIHDLHGGPSRNEISYAIRFPLAISIPPYGDDRQREIWCGFTPYGNARSFQVLLRSWSADLPDHLSEFPDTYVLDADTAKAIQALASQGPDTVRSAIQNADNQADGGAILNVKGLSLPLTMAALKKFLADHAQTDATLVSKAAVTNPSLVTPLVIGLGMQDKYFASVAIKSLMCHLKWLPPKTLGGVFMGFMVLQENQRLSEANLELLRSISDRVIRERGVSDHATDILKMVGG